MTTSVNEKDPVIENEKEEVVRKQTAVYVYEAPVRLWHWVTVFSVLTLCVTGYFIGSPLPTMPGEASDNYLMGYIRFAHFTAGYIVAIAFVGRIYWALVGNKHSRELFSPKLFSKAPNGFIQAEDLFIGMGMGLRVNLGIFLLRVDWAWPTDLYKTSKDMQILWSLGADF